MENIIQMFVCAVIIAWSGHQNQQLLNYGNKATMEMLGQTPLKTHHPEILHRKVIRKHECQTSVPC